MTGLMHVPADNGERQHTCGIVSPHVVDQIPEREHSGKEHVVNVCVVKEHEAHGGRCLSPGQHRKSEPSESVT
jgi:hypothetical protein